LVDLRRVPGDMRIRIGSGGGGDLPLACAALAFSSPVLIAAARALACYVASLLRFRRSPNTCSSRPLNSPPPPSIPLCRTGSMVRPGGSKDAPDTRHMEK